MELSKPTEHWNKPEGQQQENKKVLAGILAIFLGAFGIHKFILGYTNEGLVMLVISSLGLIFMCFLIPVFGTILMAFIGFVEGIIYLTKSDQEFYQTYQLKKRSWF